MTNKYKLDDSLILDLPTFPKDSDMEEPKYTANEMIKMCEKMLPYWNKNRFKNLPKEENFKEFVLK